MSNFDSGVASYLQTKATVYVNFPVDWSGNADIRCEQCYYFRRNYKTCGLNGEIVEYPNKFVGSGCPLEPINIEKENAHEAD